MGRPVRLDLLLVKRGLAPSRGRAQAMIEEGLITVDGMVKTKVSTQVRPEQELTLTKEDPGWVGRGALKLLGALRTFDVQVEGTTCGDFGSNSEV